MKKEVLRAKNAAMFSLGRKYGNGRRTKGRAKYTISPSKPLYDLDVQIRSMDVYDEEVRI